MSSSTTRPASILPTGGAVSVDKFIDFFSRSFRFTVVVVAADVAAAATAGFVAVFVVVVVAAVVILQFLLIYYFFSMRTIQSL